MQNVNQSTPTTMLPRHEITVLMPDASGVMSVCPCTFMCGGGTWFVVSASLVAAPSGLPHVKMTYYLVQIVGRAGMTLISTTLAARFLDWLLTQCGMLLKAMPKSNYERHDE
jgi:hypothetical protein